MSTSSTDPTRDLDLPNIPSSADASADLPIQVHLRGHDLADRRSGSSSPPAMHLPSPTAAVSLGGVWPGPPPGASLDPRHSLAAAAAGLRMSGVRLRFTQPQVEADFHQYLEMNRSRSLPLLYTALMWLLGLTEIVLDAVAIANGDEASKAVLRMALMLSALLLLAAQAAYRHLVDPRRMARQRKQVWVSVLLLATTTLCCLSWTLATHSGLDQTNKVAMFLLFLQLYIIGRRPLFFLEAAAVSTCATCIFTGLLVAYPAPMDSSAALTSHVIVLFVHLFWVVHMYREIELHERVQYAEAVQVARLQREKETLDHDTKALKGEFFQLTLERFDIADVEEEGKVLTSAMEQAMGKLQTLGKKQDLPADTLKDIMKGQPTHPTLHTTNARTPPPTLAALILTCCVVRVQ